MSHERADRPTVPVDMPCPWCHAAPGCMSVDVKLIVLGWDGFSLAGVTLKTTGKFRPVLSCSACHVYQLGEWDDDQRATFTQGAPVYGGNG